jgi:hypothetical protein
MDNRESRETWGTSAAPASSMGNGVTDPKPSRQRELGVRSGSRMERDWVETSAASVYRCGDDRRANALDESG